MNVEDQDYTERLTQEAAFWGRTAAEGAVATPPEWSAHRRLPWNVVGMREHVDAVLDSIRPGTRALELGCGPGWLTLAMARRGADAHGLDIADEALDIGRARYLEVAPGVPGRVTYERADLNHVRLPAERYDLVVVHGALHHLVGIAPLIDQVHRTLVPGGLFFIKDTNGTERRHTAFAAGLLLGLLPTRVSYRDKLRGLLRVRTGALASIRASMEAEGISPFEGAGRSTDWLALVARRFAIERRVDGPAVTGYIATELRAPEALARPFLRVLGAIDAALVRTRVLRSTALVVYARKPPDGGRI